MDKKIDLIINSKFIGSQQTHRKKELHHMDVTPRFNRTLIIHANVYDQDQGLTGRYHNTTLDTNQNNTSFILQARGLEGSNT